MIDLHTYFTRALSEGASDVHLIAGQAPVLRKDGELVLLEEDGTLVPEAFAAFLRDRLTAAQHAHLEARNELDIAYTVDGGRFRINVHYQRGLPAIAGRSIPATVPTAATIGLDEAIMRLTDEPDGLILITGPSGSGKSTTLAALIEYINDSQNVHIVTIEDPIEFIFTRKRAVFEQREIGVDTQSFASGLRAALRQDPNVILLGEMRDRESIEAALIAAETGHLILSTLHTPSAAEAIDRIITVFPADQQHRILAQLSQVLRVVVAQRLVRRRGGGLVAAREVLIVNTAAAANIREQKTAQLLSIMQTSRKEGMRTMTQAVEQLVAEGTVDPTDVTAYTYGNQ